MNLEQAKQTGDKILKGRGILNTANNAGWGTHQYRGAWGWAYPVMGFDGNQLATRWKAFNKEQTTIAGRKYTWLGSKPKHPDANWYTVGRIYKHIHDNEGVAYIANGEPSLLAYHAGGVSNVIATTAGENTIPEDTVYRCKQFLINRLIYPFDNDLAGRKSASKWNDHLAGSGIDFEALSFRDKLNDKGDANDLWIKCNFNPSLFRELIEGLPQGNLLQTAKKREYTPYTGNPTDDQGLADAIASHFGLTGGRVSGGFYTKKVTCPFHADKHPSAGIAADSGVLNCFSNCGVIDPLSVASAIGIDTSKYKQADNSRVIAPLSITAQAFEDCIEQIERLISVMQEKRHIMTHGDQRIIPNTLATLYIIRENILNKEPVTMAQLNAIETAKHLS